MKPPTQETKAPAGAIRTFTQCLEPAMTDEEGGEHADILVNYPSITLRVIRIQAKLVENPRPILTIVFEVKGFPQSVVLGIREDETKA